MLKDTYDEQLYEAVKNNLNTTAVLNNFVQYIDSTG